jgi:ribosomal protein S18 acetylase RimI-like enzyme
VLTPSRGLDARALAAVRVLEAEVVAYDGGRLKLEYGVLETRDPELVNDLLWWDGDRLLGFLGLYAFGGKDAEVGGMVAPDARRQGIATALLAAAEPLLRERGYSRLLLVTPSTTRPGAAFADAQAAVLDHSEHFLVLGETPTGDPVDPSVSVRAAVPTDEAVVRELLTQAFGWEPPGNVLERDNDATQVIERAGEPVGTLRLNRHGDVGGVYGFAVRPSLQGQGIGRDVLGRVCRLLREQGCSRVTLEVETQNANALRLYTSTGFVPEAGEDYWAVEL